ncbi:hypothetical protein [Methylomonas sp. DH-1]|uniref:hypothetical protein n=1 Tax=Methylomonas sp. (strain DH-1) TaxID=1727196 RepID=UPI0007C8A438|nr:hypothetical protein [Methylomonas sp. DH-1]ANE53822.1 hypothetical protein AYM39_00575 [Methylomonas sp. DH-1]
MNKLFYALLAAAGLVAFAPPATAHISYGDLGSLSAVGDSATMSRGRFSRFGWIAGTGDSLGDSHELASATGFFKFNLAQAANVQISVTAASAQMNPAFSVYAGLLPSHSHDYDGHDPLASYDDNLLYTASAHDRRPDDPLISHCIPAGYDNNGAVLTDPVSGYPVLVENPAWNVADPNLNGLSPAQWYAQNYQAHDGYRDTLNFTTLGGLKYEAEVGGWVPANFDVLNGSFDGFSGQFDAFGNWSMANGDGEWSRIDYISSVSSTACAGPNCVVTGSGGFANPGHFAGNDGITETLILALAAGNYTIAVDGESCNDSSLDCLAPFMAANVSVRVVPIPGAAWLMLSALVGWIGCKRRAL